MEIVIFAILAGYLFFRLWSVLGTRTGHEKEYDEKSVQRQFSIPEEDSNIVVLSRPSSKIMQEDASIPLLQRQLQKLRESFENFEERSFLRAADQAFILIIKAFSQGNLNTLKNLLDETVYDQFRLAVEERKSKGLTQQVEIDSLQSEIVSVDINNKKAQITVRFKSEQMIATFNQQGESLDNPARIKIPVGDVWTFERALKSKVPTWLLVRTSTDTLQQK